MGLFDKKTQISRSELRQDLRKATPHVPDSVRDYSQKERVAFEQGFGKKYGTLISQQEFQKKLKELSKAKAQEKTGAGKLELDRQIRYFKRLAG